MKLLPLIPLCLLFLCACGPDLLDRFDQPMTLAEYRRREKDPCPLPPSAHDIYFAVYGNWQEFEYIIRFDAPPADCERAIDAILAWHKTTPSHSATKYKVGTFGGPLPTSSSLHPVKWFDGLVIRRGLYSGEAGSHTPNIWVDLDAGRVFYYVSD